MIELRDLTAGYNGVPVLKDVSLTIAPGQVLALIGPNGCGKSTLLKTILGIHPRISGRILLDGSPLEALSSRRIAQKIAYLSQSRSVPGITAGRMVLHGRFPHLGFPRRYTAEDHRIALEALQTAGAADLVHRPLETLSGGQRQKVYLAMILAQQTDVVLLDEPTTYLDIAHQLEVMTLARNLADSGKTVILVLHDLCLALQNADRIALLSNGTLLQEGTPDELFRSGNLNTAFGITLDRMETESGIRYFYR
ncbi:MAG: ABC transporter ATP-binding protein [Clostridiales bacterium]|nr:ABC transporter ATP-binding protein [Clostridiales bacterium]